MKCWVPAVINLLLAAAVWAQSGEARFFSVTIAPDFTPLDGFFLFDQGDGRVSRVQAVLRRISEGSKEWLMAAKLPAPDPGRASKLNAVVLGESISEFLTLSEIPLPLSEAQSYGTVDGIRDYLDDRKAELREIEKQAQEGQATLARLRADAVIIADIEKIRVIKEEIEESERALKRLEGDIVTLGDAVKEAKRRPAPKNHATREADLTRQVAELASLAKVAEGGEGNRGMSAEMALQSKMALIESTRYDDLYTLQRTLDRLNESIKQFQVN